MRPQISRTITSKLEAHLVCFIYAVGLLLLTSVCIPSPASARDQAAKSIPDLTGTPWEKLNVPPGTQLLLTESTQGEQIKTLKFPGGVRIWQMPTGTIHESDNSGKGAVLCIQWIYLELKKTIEECPQPAPVEQNLQEAYFWFRLVPDSAPNYTEASSILKRVGKQLTPDQIAALDKRVAAWVPAPTGIGKNQPRLGTTTTAELQARAEQGNAEAQYELATMSADGVTIDRDLSYRIDPEKQDSSQSEKWYRKAAEQGHVTAQFELGAMYEQGFKVKRDLPEAAKWYRAAAEQGHPSAQFGLANLYTQGGSLMSDTDLAALLDEALDRIADFVAANSLTPTTKEQIEERYRAYKLPHACFGDVGARTMINDLKAKSSAQFKRSIDDLLSVPRPPAMNPCL